VQLLASGKYTVSFVSLGGQVPTASKAAMSRRVALPIYKRKGSTFELSDNKVAVLS